MRMRGLRKGAGPGGLGEKAEAGERAAGDRAMTAQQICSLYIRRPNMSHLTKPARLLARHLRATAPCTHRLCSTFLPRARPTAPPSARLPHLRSFATQSPPRQSQAHLSPITAELKDRVVEVQLPDGRTTSL